MWGNSGIVQNFVEPTVVLQMFRSGRTVLQLTGTVANDNMYSFILFLHTVIVDSVNFRFKWIKFCTKSLRNKTTHGSGF